MENIKKLYKRKISSYNHVEVITMKDTIENRLRDLRQEKKLTQDELAFELNKNLKKGEKLVSKMTISNWENNKHAIKPDKAQKLAEYFGVPVGYLLGYSEEKNLIYDGLDEVAKLKGISESQLLKMKLKIATGPLDMLVEERDNFFEYAEYLNDLAFKLIDIGAITAEDFMKLGKVQSLLYTTVDIVPEIRQKIKVLVD